MSKIEKIENLKQFEQFSEYVKNFSIRFQAFSNEIAIRNTANNIYF